MQIKNPIEIPHKSAVASFYNDFNQENQEPKQLLAQHFFLPLKSNKLWLIS